MRKMFVSVVGERFRVSACKMYLVIRAMRLDPTRLVGIP